MKMTAFRCGLAAVAIVFASLTSYAQQTEKPLTNASIVKLVRAGFKEKTVITIINNRPSRFNLDPDRLIDLKRSGVSDNIIVAMLAQQESFVMDDGDWTMDSTLGRRRTNPEAQPGGTDIFGGSAGSRASSGGRGMSGGNEQETTTSGNATVRILRPPSEGDAPAKLEKTPTLTNQSVINLVEAGFSEGTIIKRIEDSPADFDLSAPMLHELRRRRVTEPIIAAMTAAMGDDPGHTRPSTTKKGK